MMTMLGLSLSIGILIDDSIVVLENIYRRMEEGEPPMQASREGASEIGLAVMATTLSIVAVFVPVAFMKGIVGKFFFEFGITVTVAVLRLCRSLTPMISRRSYRQSHGKCIYFERSFDRYSASIVRCCTGTQKPMEGRLDRHGQYSIGIGLLSVLKRNSACCGPGPVYGVA
jgi:HAE1 family hydrophobic/amphiphilic exporter-1